MELYIHNLENAELTLDKCTDISRAAEIAKQGISVLDSNPSAGNHAENVNKIRKGKPNFKEEINTSMLSKYCAKCEKSHESKKKMSSVGQGM